MIQRIQTVYLFLVFLFAALVFFFPLSIIVAENQTITIKMFELIGVEQGQDFSNPILIGIFDSLLAFVALVTIFQFKNRKFQIKLNLVSMLLNIGLLISIFYVSDSIAGKFGDNLMPDYQFAAYFPMGSLVFIILANRSIRKDEALVKKADRLR